MDLNALIHLPVQQAVLLAQAAGYHVEVQHTAPPRGPIQGEARVVRVYQHEQTMVITASFYVCAK